MDETTTSTTLIDPPGNPTGDPTPADGSTVVPSTLPESNSPPSPMFGKQSPTRRTPPTALSIEIVKALAVLQDALRLFVMAGGMLRAPYVNEKGILILALKLRDHDLGVGPEGNFTVDGTSVMEGRRE